MTDMTTQAGAMEAPADKRTDEEKRLADIQERGRYAVQENDDNAIAISDPNFIGTDPNYANFANPSDAPLASEDPYLAALEETAREHAEEMKLPQVPDVPHPTEAVNPANVTLEQNDEYRARHEAVKSTSTQAQYPVASSMSTAPLTSSPEVTGMPPTAAK